MVEMFIDGLILITVIWLIIGAISVEVMGRYWIYFAKKKWGYDKSNLAEKMDLKPITGKDYFIDIFLWPFTLRWALHGIKNWTEYLDLDKQNQEK